LTRLTHTVHALLTAHLRPGDRALDLTAGNGHDTATLARLVGPTGFVWAFDLQAPALATTRRRLAAEGLESRTALIQADHRAWITHVPQAAGTLAAVVANLGYLPGGDKSIITTPDSSLPALQAAWHALRPGGLLAVVIYRGHPGGLEEDRAITAWTATLSTPAHWTDSAPPTGPRLLTLTHALQDRKPL
jgi:predicted methyltransferase